MSHKITKWFIWSVFVIVILFDIYAELAHGLTISKALLKTNEKYPVLGFSWGVLTGHLLWPQKADPAPKFDNVH